MLLILLPACDRPESADAQPDEPRQTEQADEPVSPELVVGGGELPESPERIVSLAPNVTEILFALDADDRLKAVTRFCDYPPEAKELPNIGGMVEPDFEAILAQRPDLVIGVTSGGDKRIAEKLERAEVPHVFMRMDDLAETYRGIEKIGELVGEEERATAIVEETKERIAQLSRSPGDDAPRVLLLYGREPLVAAGPGSFGHELIELAGAKNAVEEANGGYANLDVERIIGLNPDRLIDASMAAEESDDDFWAEYDAIEAVDSGHVYRLRETVLLRPTPRLVGGLELMREVVEGEAPAEVAKDGGGSHR